MEAVIKKWGNSLGIRIPNVIAKRLSLRESSPVEIEDNGEEITIRPVQKYTLSEMLGQITKKNIHEEVKSSGPVGRETW